VIRFYTILLFNISQLCFVSYSSARKEFHENIGKQSTSVVSFDGYGSNFIKKSGNPPDAFVQVAMQLASARLFGEQVGTYEATQVRRFLHGRTEVTRAVTLESEAFVKHMIDSMGENDDVETQRERFELLRKATGAHASYSQLAAQAMGVDRHFFGLAMLAESEEEKPGVYSDPVFNRSKYWRMSTSNLSHPRIVNWGFGQVVSDGVGIGYSIHPNSLNFNISALESTRWSPRLAKLLEESLNEMQVIAAVGSNQKPMSKL
jgi:carnitine O-acetyltransferase